MSSLYLNRMPISLLVALKEKAPSAPTYAAWKALQGLVQRSAAPGMTHKQPISEEHLKSEL